MPRSQRIRQLFFYGSPSLLLDAKVCKRARPDIFNQATANAFSAFSAYAAVKSFTSPPSPAGETFQAQRHFYLSHASAHARRRRRQMSLTKGAARAGSIGIRD